LAGTDRRKLVYVAASAARRWCAPRDADRPPKWDWVDPLKDARAEIEQIDAGLKSRTQALTERGYDAEQVDAEIAADQAREKSLGLSFGSFSSTAMVQDAPSATDRNCG
jgi:capsid protein